MTGHTHTIAEWVAMVDIAASGYASFSCFYFLLVDAEPRDFDPRPAVRKVHQAAVHAGHDVNRAIATSQRVSAAALRDAAISLAALLMLLSAPPKGAIR